MPECLYATGTCDHAACADYWDAVDHDEPPQPTVEDYCAGMGHAYYGDDGDVGRCYCGTKTYPLGGDR